MPRRNLARRFEPRFGVSQQMLDVECRYVEKELENYLLLSLNDLKTKLVKGRERIEIVEMELRHSLSRLPDRERLSLQCMLTRDFIHMAMLYRTFLEKPSMAQLASTLTLAIQQRDPEVEAVPIVPFSEWLFEP